MTYNLTSDRLLIFPCTSSVNGLVPFGGVCSFTGMTFIYSFHQWTLITLEINYVDFVIKAANLCIKLINADLTGRLFYFNQQDTSISNS